MMGRYVILQMDTAHLSFRQRIVPEALRARFLRDDFFIDSAALWRVGAKIAVRYLYVPPAPPILGLWVLGQSQSTF